MKNVRIPLIGKIPSTAPVIRWVPPAAKPKTRPPVR
jgi:hypothetical protein